MNILHESDIHDAVPTIGICEHEGKEYLYVWYGHTTTKEYERLYVYVELTSRDLLKQYDMYLIYSMSTQRYTGIWGEIKPIAMITDDMLPIRGEYYNEGEANTS